VVIRERRSRACTTLANEGSRCGGRQRRPTPGVTLTFGIIWPMNASAVLGCARKERTCSSFLLFRGVTRSLGVESHVVGAARDLDVVPFKRGVVVRALHVHITADGAKVLLVEG
jgi:hypothetical protein